MQDSTSHLAHKRWWLWYYVSCPSEDPQTDLPKIVTWHFTCVLLGVSNLHFPHWSLGLCPWTCPSLVAQAKNLRLTFHSPLSSLPHIQPIGKSSSAFEATLILTTCHSIHCHPPSPSHHLTTWMIAMASKLFILLLPLSRPAFPPPPIYYQHRATF